MLARSAPPPTKICFSARKSNLQKEKSNKNFPGQNNAVRKSLTIILKIVCEKSCSY